MSTKIVGVMEIIKGVPCPVCLAERGRDCSLMGGFGSNFTAKRPHAERLAAARDSLFNADKVK